MAALQQLEVYAYYEVAFPAEGDLGIGIKVDKDGLVVVSDVKQLKGCAELQCPELASGDLLVAVDHEPVLDKGFQQVMTVLHESKHTRPTHLEFLSVDYYAARAGAVAKWTERHRHLRQHQEGEFDVDFAPLQPTGLRFTESYVMASPLRLTHIDEALLKKTVLPLHEHAQVRKPLLNMVLVRIGAQSVLGAPVGEVTALLLRETENDGTGATSAFPKALWLASADNLDEDYVVLTLAHIEQLKWLHFEPMEMMMEVPAVSFAAKSVTSPVDQPVSGDTSQRERRDGIKSEQYLMAINGVSTMRLSAPASSSIANSVFHDGREHQKPLLDEVTKALDGLVGCERTLRFRDLTQYRREFQQQQPLSPWRRMQRRSESLLLVDSEANVNGSSKAGSKASATRDSVGIQERPGSLTITRRPRELVELLKEDTDVPSVELEQTRQCPDEPQDPAASDAAKRLYIQKHPRNLTNCEGTRRMTSSDPVIDEHMKRVVISDNLRPVGMQLETELMTTRTIFKRFTRMDGPALASKQVARGDLVISIDGSSVEDIPMDTLVRLLQGEQAESKPPGDKITSESPSVRIFRFARKKPRNAVTAVLADMWARSSSSATRAKAHEKAAGKKGQGEAKEKKNLMVEFTDLEDELRDASTVSYDQ